MQVEGARRNAGIWLCVFEAARQCMCIASWGYQCALLRLTGRGRRLSHSSQPFPTCICLKYIMATMKFQEHMISGMTAFSLCTKSITERSLDPGANKPVAWPLSSKPVGLVCLQKKGKTIKSEMIARICVSAQRLPSTGPAFNMLSNDTKSGKQYAQQWRPAGPMRTTRLDRSEPTVRTEASRAHRQDRPQTGWTGFGCARWVEVVLPLRKT